MISLPLAFALMLVGILAQFVARMATLEDSGKVPSAWQYLREHPYRCISLVASCSILILVFQDLGQLNAVTAILTGYTCQDAADRLRIRAKAKLGPTTDGESLP
jgi:hypothetical protein